MRLLRILMALLAIMVISLPVQAQRQRPPRGERPQLGQRLTPEQAKAAWELQARTMAAGLTLSDENTTMLVEAYVKARQSYGKAIDDLRAKWRDANQGGDRQDPPDRGRGVGAEMREQMIELRTAEQEKLQARLKSFLKGEQLEYATEVLGSFNYGWDNMVHAITELKLEKEKTGQSLKVIEAHIAETVELRRGDDRQAMREAQAAARAKLSEKMKEILDEEQFAQFQQAMGGRRGARGPDGRGAGGMAARFDEWDANGDGKLQKDEVPEQMLPLFDRLDANGDGALDEEELQAGGRGRGGGGQRGRGGGGDGF